MANQATITVRVPAQLRKSIMRLVDAGFYKNFSDAVLAGLRREVNELDTAVVQSREAKKAVWDEYLKKAGGDREKASKLMFEDGKKWEAEEEKKNPGFFRHIKSDGL